LREKEGGAERLLEREREKRRTGQKLLGHLEELVGAETAEGLEAEHAERKCCDLHVVVNREIFQMAELAQLRGQGAQLIVLH
jgi:hypothetical protein